MGLLASSYIDLFTTTGEKIYEEKIHHCFQLLNQNKVVIGKGIGWGYPFDWQSAKKIKANTPNGIVSTAVGEAYWKYYQLTKDPTILEVCSSIALFLSELPKDQITDEQICFSYTPLYTNHVHNLNLFVAEYLLKIGLETGKQEMINLSEKAVNYTLAAQEENGAFDYNGPPEKPQHFYDNYHTSFVIRMLHSIYKLNKNKDVKSSLERCLSHWKGNFFLDDGTPKFTPHRIHRIDIHSSAEAVNCLAQLEQDYPKSIELAEKVLLWTIENLQDKSGYFYHGIFKSRFIGKPFKSRIPYMRWGQAWMLKAFSSYMFTQKMITSAT